MRFGSVRLSMRYCRTLGIFTSRCNRLELIKEGTLARQSCSAWQRLRLQKSHMRLKRKRTYLLQLLERETGWSLDDDCRAQLNSIVQVRNRIVHMASLSSPKKILSVLNVRQIRYTASLAVDVASEYTE